MESNSYYSGLHSNELYSTMSLPKFIENRNDTATYLFYLRKSHNVSPMNIKGGSAKEKNALKKLKSIISYMTIRNLY